MAAKFEVSLVRHQQIFQKFVFTSTSGQAKTFVLYMLENPALPRVLIVTHAVYPRLVVNYNFSHFFPIKDPLDLES